MLEEELLSLDELSVRIAHAIRTRTVAVAVAGASAALSPATASAEVLATASSPESRGAVAVHRTTRNQHPSRQTAPTALSPSAASPSPPRTEASPNGASLSLSPRLPIQCDSLPESLQLHRVLDDMGILEVEQKHASQATTQSF